MSEKTRLALGILAASAVLGLLGNWLLWSSDWGWNVGLFIAVAVAAALGLRRFGGGERGPNWPFVAAVGFAAAFAWRDSAWLRTLDALVLGVALSVPFWRPAAGSLRRALPGEAAAGAAHAAAMSVAGWAFVLDPGIPWREVNQGSTMRHGVGVLTGLALALPLLLVFGALFMSADAGFEGLVRAAFSMNVEAWIGHAFVIALLAWGTGGFLYGLLWPRALGGLRGFALTLGLVPVATVLVLLVLLFGTFVATQLPYLFGGAALVTQSDGLTYAEYARRGFFELVTVTTLTLPLLLALHAMAGATERAETVFRWLAGAMLVLLGVIIASAMHRMWLYQAEFGWTSARLYVLAFELWLGVVLGWFAATVLRGRRDAFLFGTVAWGMVAAGLLHLPNWEAMVVRHNVALASQGRPVGTSYLNDLSLDAVPALAAALPELQGETARHAAYRLQEAYEHTLAPDWRSWRWAQHAARAALGGDRALRDGLTRPLVGPPEPYTRDWRQRGD